MTALKKTGVAAMIMLACIVLAIIIGENRKESYIKTNAEVEAATGETQTAVTSTEDTVWDNFMGITTWGKIREEIKEGQEMVNYTPEEEKRLSFGKVVGIIVLLLIIVSIFGNRR